MRVAEKSDLTVPEGFCIIKIRLIRMFSDFAINKLSRDG